MATTTWVGWCSAVVALLPLAAQAAGTKQAYKVNRLVADGAGATKQDPNLVNPIGLAVAPNGALWVANNGTGVAMAYNGKGKSLSTPITIPAALGNPGLGTPTGVVFNPTSRFVLKAAARSGPARFLFSTGDGTVSGWNSAVSAGSAVRMADRAPFQAMYTGLAINNHRDSDLLYAANFRAGTIDVFDSKFRPVRLAGSFDDETIPSGFAPFNIESIGDLLYVTYARRSEGLDEDVPGAGSGFIDVFNPNGTFVRRLVTGSKLNSPRGLALAPSNFGRFSKMLLVGNAGDGRISAFNPKTGAFKGQLKDGKGWPISIDGLSDIAFGNGVGLSSANTLFFTAGPHDGLNGLLGRIQSVNVQDRAMDQALMSLPAVPEPGMPGILGICMMILGLRRRASR